MKYLYTGVVDQTSLDNDNLALSLLEASSDQVGKHRQMTTRGSMATPEEKKEVGKGPRAVLTRSL